MPFTYAKDDTRRRIRVKLHDPIRLDEAIAIVQQQAVDGAWAYHLLYDARGITSPPDSAQAAQVLEHVKRLIAEYGPRGRVALVTRHPDMIALSQGYAFNAAKTAVEVQVFWDINEAERWLDEQL
jgi:hypothetical protein